MREDDEIAPGSGTTREERRRDSSRVLALTDGVFAIIITLLVLDIHVPELTSHESLRAADIGRTAQLHQLCARLHRGGDAVGRPPGPFHADQVHRPWHHLAQFADPVHGVPAAVRLRAAQPLSPRPARAAPVRPDPDGHLRHPGPPSGPMRRKGHPWCTSPWTERRSGRGWRCPSFPCLVYLAAFAIAAVSPRASLAVYASAPVLYFIAITLLRWLAPRGVGRTSVHLVRQRVAWRRPGRFSCGGRAAAGGARTAGRNSEATRPTRPTTAKAIIASP